MNGVILSQDWANLKKYKKQNAKLGSPKANENRIVFFGNSITESWIELYPEYFSGKDYINRGITNISYYNFIRYIFRNCKNIACWCISK